jgi:excisionase family DNA binding protein
MVLPPDRLAYTPNEVADALGLDGQTVRRLITSGRLRAVNVGSNADGRPRWIVPGTAIEEFLGADGAA